MFGITLENNKLNKLLEVITDYVMLIIITTQQITKKIDDLLRSPTFLGEQKRANKANQIKGLTSTLVADHNQLKKFKT